MPNEPMAARGDGVALLDPPVLVLVAQPASSAIEEAVTARRVNMSGSQAMTGALCRNQRASATLVGEFETSRRVRAAER